MRVLFTIAIALISLLAWSQQGPVTRDSVAPLDMLVADITTVDSVMPSCDFVSCPDGAFGKSITNAVKLPGRLVITMHGDTLYDSGPYVDGVSGMTVRITGNSSAYKLPYPYKIKLQKKADLLLRDDDIYKDKDWRLMRDDRSLNMVTGLKVNQLMGMQWTPQYRYCNVLINGVYQGLYLITENVKRNSDCRLDVSKQGYIVERDAYWWNEDVHFNTSFFADMRYGYTFKYPDQDDVTQAQINYIKDYITQAELAIDNGTYDEYIDVGTFATWLLTHDILGTWDSGGSNLYMTKYDNTAASKLMMANLWDFDSSQQTSYNYSRYHTGKDFYFEKLFNSPNSRFRDLYLYKWLSVKDNLIPLISNYLNDFVLANAEAVNASRQFVCNTYGYDFVSMESNVTQQQKWFTNQLSWLKKHVVGPSIPTPVDDINADPASTGRTYNLQGIEVPADTRGLVIRDGRLIKQ